MPIQSERIANVFLQQYANKVSVMPRVVVQCSYRRRIFRIDMKPDGFALFQIQRRLNGKRFRVFAGFISPLHVDLAHCMANSTNNRASLQEDTEFARQRSRPARRNTGHGEKVTTLNWGLEAI